MRPFLHSEPCGLLNIDGAAVLASLAVNYPKLAGIAVANEPPACVHSASRPAAIISSPNWIRYFPLYFSRGCKSGGIRIAVSGAASSATSVFVFVGGLDGSVGSLVVECWFPNPYNLIDRLFAKTSPIQRGLGVSCLRISLRLCFPTKMRCPFRCQISVLSSHFRMVLDRTKLSTIYDRIGRWEIESGIFLPTPFRWERDIVSLAHWLLDRSSSSSCIVGHPSLSGCTTNYTCSLCLSYHHKLRFIAVRSPLNFSAPNLVPLFPHPFQGAGSDMFVLYAPAVQIISKPRAT